MFKGKIKAAIKKTVIRRNQDRVKKPLKVRLFFVISIFVIIILSGVISSLGIAALNASGVLNYIDDPMYASMMISMLISVIIGGLLTIIWCNIILDPVCTFIDATRMIASGNYDVKVEFDKLPKHILGLQLSTLAESFNQMSAELASTEMFRNDFISNFSHEFKTPILSIYGFAEQIYKGDLTEEERNEFARIIMEESGRLAALSSNVLLLSKLENQDIVSDKEEYNLDEQIRSCILLFEENWTKKNLNIVVDVDRVKYFQNQDMVALIWKNLMSNAIKYNSENGSIYVTCKQNHESGEITVSFRDTGIGMDEETVNSVFDKFYQYDSSRATEGNGLGLAIIKKTLVLIDGEIEVKSTVGEGSEFIVHLH